MWQPLNTAPEDEEFIVLTDDGEAIGWRDGDRIEVIGPKPAKAWRPITSARTGSSRAE